MFLLIIALRTYVSNRYLETNFVGINAFLHNVRKMNGKDCLGISRPGSLFLGGGANFIMSLKPFEYLHVFDSIYTARPYRLPSLSLSMRYWD